MVGDKATDVDLAHNAGCQGILVQTGFDKQALSGVDLHHAQPDFIAQNLAVQSCGSGIKFKYCMDG